jgi:putative membrane protein
LTVVLSGLGLLGALLAVLLIVAAPDTAPTDTPTSGSEEGPPGAIVLLVVATLVLRPAYEVLSWWFRTYQVGSHELVVDEGILSRHHRVVPYARLQQVDLHQSLVHQLLGLAELRLETAGEAGATVVRLRLLDLPRARGLRTFLLDRRARLQDAGQDGAPGRSGAGTPPVEAPLLRLGAGELALAALTHGSVTAGAPVCLLGGLWLGAFLVRDESGARAATLVTLALAAGVIGAATLVTVRLAALLVGRFGFTVTAVGDDLHLRFGLFERRNLTVPRRRVQRLSVVDNPLRRVLGAVEVTLHTASTGIGGEQATTRFEIPLLPRAELDAFLARLMGGGDWTVPPITPRGPAARRRGVVRRTLLLLAAAVVPAVLTRPGGLVLLSLALLGPPWGLAAHRRAGLGLSDTVVATSHGVLHHRIDLVPVARIQSCRTTATPLQRVNRLATLHLDVAGSPRAPLLYDLDREVATRHLRSLPRRSAPTRRPTQGARVRGR